MNEHLCTELICSDNRQVGFHAEKNHEQRVVSVHARRMPCLAFSQPTIQLTKGDDLHDFRELWQSPRCCKLLKTINPLSRQRLRVRVPSTPPLKTMALY